MLDDDDKAIIMGVIILPVLLIGVIFAFCGVWACVEWFCRLLIGG